jgi:tryptophan synthase alpha subunit
MRGLAPYADAAVVGSAFMRVVEENLQAPDLADKMRDLAAALKAGLKVPE